MSTDNTFRLIILIGFIIVIPIGVHHRMKSWATGDQISRRQEGLFILCTLRPIAAAGMLGLIAWLIYPPAMAWSSLPLPLWLRWMGVGFGALASMLLIATFFSLGTNITDTVVTKRDHTLVTHGPYRWIRHPLYTSVALAVLANSLTTANWFIFLTGATAFALLVVRTRKEEENLITRFGDEYRRYMRQTGRFVPRLSDSSSRT